MYINTATSILPLLPGLPQTNTVAGYSATVSRIASHITRAEAYVNAKISSRYDVSSFTSTAVPPILKTLTEDISSYYTLRSVYTGDNQNVSEWVETFSEALEMLDAIRDGKMDLIDSDGSLIGASTSTFVVESTTEDLTPSFDESDPIDWEVDENK